MKDNIFIMYTDYDHVCEYINYKLPLARGTDTPKLVGKPLNFENVTTTNAVHNENFINRNSSLYKYLLPSAGEEKIQSLQISLILGDGTPLGLKKVNLWGKGWG
jgi:hypothetical protein